MNENLCIFISAYGNVFIVKQLLLNLLKSMREYFQSFISLRRIVSQFWIERKSFLRNIYYKYNHIVGLFVVHDPDAPISCLLSSFLPVSLCFFKLVFTQCGFMTPVKHMKSARFEKYMNRHFYLCRFKTQESMFQARYLKKGFTLLFTPMGTFTSP